MGSDKIYNQFSNINQSFRLYFSWFRMGGIPLKYYNKSIKYTIYSVIVFINSYTTSLGMIIDMFWHIGDLEHVIENARIVFPCCTALWIHVTLSFKKKSLVELICQTEKFDWEYLKSKAIQSKDFTMSSILLRVKPATLQIMTGIILFHGGYCVLRVLLGENRPLTLNAHYFFDTSPSPIYEIINVLQFIMALSVFVPFFGFTSLYAFLVAIVCSQLEKLKADLITIKQKNTASKEDSDPENDQDEKEGIHISQEVSHHMQKQLNHCIYHHQQIMQYMKTLEETVNLVLLGHFVFILGGMCLAAFSIAVSWGKSFHMSQAFIAYLSFLGQLCIYCWLGNEMTMRAENVRQAAWESDWVGTSVPFQRSVLFIIAASTKEVVLTAGKFVPVSRKTMMNVINQTISFLMFLMHVKDNEIEMDTP